MEQFDHLFYSVFNHYKPTHKNKANRIALVYISVLQLSILMLLGIFFSLFLNQMHVDVMSASKGWSLYVIIVIILIFRNWMYYSGKKRKVLNTKISKSQSQQTKMWLLWLVPICCILFSIVLYQRL